MLRKTPRTSVLLVLGVLVVSSACGATRVNHILADPARYANREVRIAGAVVDSYSVANRGVYLLQDDTERLWIVSTRGVPRLGARVSVKGVVRDGFNLGQLGSRLNLPPGVRHGLVLVESSHKAQD